MRRSKIYKEAVKAVADKAINVYGINEFGVQCVEVTYDNRYSMAYSRIIDKIYDLIDAYIKEWKSIKGKWVSEYLFYDDVIEEIIRIQNF